MVFLCFYFRFALACCIVSILDVEFIVSLLCDASDAAGDWILALGGFCCLRLIDVFLRFSSSCVGTPMPCTLSVQVRLYLVVSLFEYRFSFCFA